MQQQSKKLDLIGQVCPWPVIFTLKELKTLEDGEVLEVIVDHLPSTICLLYTSPSPRDRTRSRMPSSA